MGGSVYPPKNRSYTNGIMPLMTEQIDVYAESEVRNWDIGSQETAMHNEGIDMAIMFSSRGLFSLGSDEIEPGLATAICRTCNDLLGDFAPNRTEYLE